MKKNVKDYTENGKTVAWLKNKLQEFIDDLDQYDDDQLLDLKNNTYWIHSDWFIQAGNVGFIDLYSPVTDEEEDEDEDIEDALPSEFTYSVEGSMNYKIFQHKHSDLQAAKADFDKMKARLADIEGSYVELWNIKDDKLIASWDPKLQVKDSAELMTWEVLLMHQDYSETLHFIKARSQDELERKLGKIDPYYIDYDVRNVVKAYVGDSQAELEMALKMEKDTIAQYQDYSRRAGDGDNPEKQLWDHLIEDEEEHVREIEAAMKGDYTEIIHDAANGFQQSVDGVAKLLRKNKLQENVSFAEGDQSFKTVLVETPNDKFDDVLKVLKEEYEIDSHNGKNRIFVKIKDSWELPSKEEEQAETFIDHINDVLVDAGIDRSKFHIDGSGIDYYIDFGSNEKEADMAYEALRDALFKCNYVKDESYYYIHVIRR